MSTAESSKPVYYISLYRHFVDDKRRVQIPAKWRSDSVREFNLVLWPNGSEKDACLLALPPAEWADLVQKLKTMSFSDPKAESLRRLIGTKSDWVSVDKAGRICLPEGMTKAVGIEAEAEVLLVGLVDLAGAWPCWVVMCRPRCMAMVNALPHFWHLNPALFLRGIFVLLFLSCGS